MLLAAYRKFGKKWSLIAKEALVQRTPEQCRIRMTMCYPHKMDCRTGISKHVSDKFTLLKSLACFALSAFAIMMHIGDFMKLSSQRPSADVNVQCSPSRGYSCLLSLESH